MSSLEHRIKAYKACNVTVKNIFGMQNPEETSSIQIPEIVNATRSVIAEEILAYTEFSSSFCNSSLSQERIENEQKLPIVFSDNDGCVLQKVI